MLPPHGVIVGIGNPPSYAGISQPSFRAEALWPATAVRMERESVTYIYSSRVQLATGLIADTGCSLYRGTDIAIRDQLRRVWDVTLQICGEVTVGMTFAELHSRAMLLIDDAGLQNNVHSVNDKALTNIGHTIPWTAEALTTRDVDVFDNGTPEQLAELVSSRRRFLNASEQLVVTDRLVFTVEPRLSAPGLPNVGFHVLVGFEYGKRSIVTEYDPLFELFEMDLTHD